MGFLPSLACCGGVGGWVGAREDHVWGCHCLWVEGPLASLHIQRNLIDAPHPTHVLGPSLPSPLVVGP